MDIIISKMNKNICVNSLFFNFFIIRYPIVAGIKLHTASNNLSEKFMYPIRRKGINNIKYNLIKKFDRFELSLNLYKRTKKNDVKTQKSYRMPALYPLSFKALSK